MSNAAVAHAVSPSIRGLAGVLDEAPPAPETTPRTPFQPKLFTTRELGRVVPIEFYQKADAPPVRGERTAPAVRTKRAVTADLAGLQQQAFDFEAAQSAKAQPSRLPGQAHKRRVPVAVPVHRVLAGALDTSLVCAGVALMTLVVHLMIGLGFLGAYWLPAIGGLTGFVAVAYKMLWIWAETESPGLRWVQLRLVNFDGKSPDRRQRLQRFGWSAVSMMAGCLGLIWSLVDEESLTWHDHSSKTFLTCYTTSHGASAHR